MDDLAVCLLKQKEIPIKKILEINQTSIKMVLQVFKQYLILANQCWEGRQLRACKWKDSWEILDYQCQM